MLNWFNILFWCSHRRGNTGLNHVVRVPNHMQNKTTSVGDAIRSGLGGGANRSKSSGNEEVAPPQTEFNSSERTALLHALSAAATEIQGMRATSSTGSVQARKRLRRHRGSAE